MAAAISARSVCDSNFYLSIEEAEVNGKVISEDINGTNDRGQNT